MSDRWPQNPDLSGLVEDQTSLSGEARQKIAFSLVEHAYAQQGISLLATVACGIIAFCILYDPHESNRALFSWGGVFLAVQGFRLACWIRFSIKEKTVKHTGRWRRLYTLGGILSGVIWGLSGLVFFPIISPLQQSLLILVMAGVAAGSIPLAASIPGAGIAFLVTSIVPFMFSILLFDKAAYYFFDVALAIYLAYAIALTLKTWKLIQGIFVLKYEKDVLLANLETSNRKLEFSATHDPLTNVANRRLFEGMLEKAIHDAKTTQTRFALFYLDLDNFKSANDTYGHEAGDHVLKTVAYRLSLCARRKGHVARLGGDEFAVIFEEISHIGAIDRMGREICQAVAMPVYLNHATLSVTGSVGVSLYPEDGISQDELVTCADHRMYGVKQRGGNDFYCVTNKSVQSTT